MKQLALILFASILFLFAGCSPSNSSDQVVSPTVSILPESSATALVETPETVMTEKPTETQIIETAVVVTELPTPQIIETQAQIIEHKEQPGRSVFNKQLLEECNTIYSFTKNMLWIGAPCDSWATNLLERPVSADLKIFYDYLDILSSRIGTDGRWIYGSLDLAGPGAPDDGVSATHFLELDIDQNGRGDFLVAVSNMDVPSNDWSVVGVSVWKDGNGDVGGPTPVRSDTTSGDGYETLIFDSGIGEDPDLCWARRPVESPSQIHIAFKLSMLEGKNSFLWWAGALRGEFNPGQFDLVDTQLSSEVYEIDTTCGTVFGSEYGYNAKKCYVQAAPTAKPDEKPGKLPGTTASGCPSPTSPKPSNDPCWIWIEDAYDYECEWVCFN